MIDKGKRIKIAQVITRLDHGGSPDILRIICSCLDTEIYDIRLITGATRHPSTKTQEFLKRFRDKVTVIPSLQRNINPISDLSAFIRLFLLFHRERFGIVHTHTAKAGVLGRIAAFLAPKTLIVHTPHGHNFYGYFGPVISKIIIRIERFLTGFTDRIVVFTELEKKDFIRFKVADAKKVSLIYQGLELERYITQDTDKAKVKKNFGIQPDEEVVGMISRLEPIKGPGYFIEAAKAVSREFPETRFILVGEGSLRQRLEEQADDLGLKDRVIFAGWRDDIPEILSIMDILVLPSLNEAVGMVLIEAQSAGVPVIATKVGGIPEVVKDNETGLLIPPRSSWDLARAINSLLADKQKRLDMGKSARLSVKDRFRPQDMVNKISDLYIELMKK